jgi:hypothetical protein
MSAEAPTTQIKDRRRQLLVQSLGLLVALLGLLGIISTLLNGSKPLISFQFIEGWPLDLIGLAALSSGYHLFRLREFGRKVIILLTWISSVFSLLIGGFAISQPDLLQLGVQGLEIQFTINSPWSVFAVIGVNLLVAILINLFLFQPATKALFRR